MTTEMTSTGMPPIAPAHDALESIKTSASPSGKPAQAVQSLIGEGKAQVSSTLGGVAEAVRDIATKLEGNGGAPVAKYVHDAADTVTQWAESIDRKSVDDLLGDTRTLVRTSPAVAVGLALTAGFVVSRILRSAR